jgi:hypothetical protein
MNQNDLLTKLSDDLSNHNELNAFLDTYMSKNHPELKPEQFETNEQMESTYYGLRNGIFCTIMNRVIGSMHSIKK